MKFSLFDDSTAKYTPLGSTDEEKHFSNQRNGRTWLNAFSSIVVLAVVSTASYAAGAHSLRTTPSTTEILNFSSHPHTFHYNCTFSNPPNATTNKAWEDLFPPQGGFFKHPDLASQRSTFAVFHQLHCLDGLRHGYWTLYDLLSSGQSLPDDEADLPFHASPRHVRHCIDLLRNVLVCHPDLTLEVKDEELGGVTGFGTEHQCVNWEELKGWTEEWETFGQGEGKVSGEEHHGHEHEHEH